MNEVSRETLVRVVVMDNYRVLEATINRLYGDGYRLIGPVVPVQVNSNYVYYTATLVCGNGRKEDSSPYPGQLSFCDQKAN